MDKVESYTVGWIVALSHELTAALEMLDEEYDEEPSDFARNERDSNSYSWGKIGRHFVVLVCLPAGSMGTTAAASTVAHMLSSIPGLRVGLFVGIGAGIPYEVDADGVSRLSYDLCLGDVVVSRPEGTHGSVVQYDYGKAFPESFERKGHLAAPSPLLLSALSRIEAQHLRRKRKLDGHLKKLSQNEFMKGSFDDPGPGKDPLWPDFNRSPHRERPKVHYGTIASGNLVVKSAEKRTEILQMFKKENIRPRCLEMEAAGVMNNFPCLVIRGVCDYADEGKDDVWQNFAAAAAASYAKEFLGYVEAVAVKDLPKIADVVKGVEHVQESISNLSNKIDLSKLPVVEDASYDSKGNEDLPLCLLGTRIEVKDQVADWAQDPDGKSIFWLSGKAGTGKSTIARTIAKSLDDRGQLAGSFFFRRGEGYRGTAQRFFPTLATQLVNKEPRLQEQLSKAIDDEPNLPFKRLNLQFERLLLQPLSTLAASTTETKPLFVVIDALDECDSTNDIRKIVQLLGRTHAAKLASLRLFVTSRPELAIREEFHDLSEEAHLDVDLHAVDKDTIDRDIRLFLATEFAKIEARYSARYPSSQLPLGWPGDYRLRVLTKLAIPLFIFAATVCRFVGDFRADPIERLQSILKQSYTSYQSQLERTYLPIFESITADLDSESKQAATEEVLEIIGAIVILAEPLSSLALSSLTLIPSGRINRWLLLLHSVFNISENPARPIRLHHISFRDFLVDENRRHPGVFWVDQRLFHERLATDCVRLLSSNHVLKMDICGFKRPAELRANVSSDIINTRISAAVRYACLYWVSHLKESGHRIDDDNPFFRFLEKHFLHWLEACAWLGRVPDVLKQLDDLRALRKENTPHSMTELLDDASRFVLSNRHVIAATPLQIYYSCLTFAPTQSPIRHLFENPLKDICSVLPETQTVWNLESQRLESPQPRSYVGSIAVSPNGHLLASGTGHKTVQIWDHLSGEEVQTFEGHEASVDSVAFSPDGQVVASGSEDGTVRIWDMTAGEQINMLVLAFQSEVGSVAFSPDGTTVGIGPLDGIPRLWDIYSGPGNKFIESEDGTIAFERSFQEALATTVSLASRDQVSLTSGPLKSIESVVRRLGKHESKLNSVAFSHDGLLFASGCESGTVRLWNPFSRENVFELPADDSSLRALAFSPQGDLLACGYLDGGIHLWDTRSHTRVMTLDTDDDSVLCLAFSLNGQRLMAACWDDFWLWNISGETILSLSTLEQRITGVVFLREDGQTFASANRDGTIHLWDVDSIQSQRGRAYQEPRRHPIDLAFSEHGSVLVSRFHSSVELWDAATCAKTLTIRRETVFDAGKSQEIAVEQCSFCPDARILAVVYADLEANLWDVTSLKKMRCLSLQTTDFASGPIMAVALSKAGSELVVGFEANIVRLWDTHPSKLTATLEHQRESTLTSAVFSKDDRLLALGDDTGNVELRIRPSWNLVKSLDTTGEPIRCLTFHPKEPYLVACDDTLQVSTWDVETGNQLARYYNGRHTTQLLFSDHGSTLHSSSGSIVATAHPVWDRNIRQRLRRHLSPLLTLTREWLEFRDVSLVWLAPDYHHAGFAVHDTTVALSRPSGEISFFKIDDKKATRFLEHCGYEKTL